MKSWSRIALGAAVSACVFISGSPAALAEDAADSLASSVEAVTGTADVVPDEAAASNSEDVAITTVNDSTVAVPRDAADGVDVSNDGTTVTLGIPESESVNEGQMTDEGTTTFVSKTGETSTSVQALTDGGVRQVYTLGQASETDIVIPVKLTDGAELVQDPEDGSVVVAADQDGSLVPVGTFATPWAVDANGVQLATTYTVQNDTLVQHVETTADTAFPVQADPQFTWGWLSGTIYFNKRETKLAALAGTFTSWIPSPYTVVTGRTVVAWAGIAVATDSCIKLKINTIIVWGYSYNTLQMSLYTGGYCR